MSEIVSVITQDKQVRLESSRRLGDLGERMAAEYLIGLGFRLVAANFTVPVGRNSRGVQVTGEIDLIALDDEKLCFIEVKTRRSAAFTPLLTNVGLRKQRQITRTTRVYRRIFGLLDMEHRYDVVTVLIPEVGAPEIEHIKAFWHEGKFRKRRWNTQTWQDFI